ncbi:MAG: hypothetical protein HYW24_02680 [Candidatus Aenigmarchaeota archaeon]|nr:hypothetical protein [Candidatus Aenigmarchaeota archaeon]
MEYNELKEKWGDKEKKKSRTRMYILIGVVVIILLAVVWFLVLNRESPLNDIIQITAPIQNAPEEIPPIPP